MCVAIHFRFAMLCLSLRGGGCGQSPIQVGGEDSFPDTEGRQGFRGPPFLTIQSARSVRPCSGDAVNRRRRRAPPRTAFHAGHEAAMTSRRRPSEVTSQGLRVPSADGAWTLGSQ